MTFTRHLQTWCARLPVQKMIAAATAFCFLFSFVAAPAAEALVAAGRDARQFNTLLDNFVLPATMGRVTDLRDFGSDKVVVNIQDLHCHPEVQRNIARILALLDKKYKLGSVYVEGAAGDIDTSWLVGIRNLQVKNALVESLLDQGKLTGTEYFTVLENRPQALKGIEDEALYRSNFLRLDRILTNQKKYEHDIALLKYAADGFKKDYFTADNRRFEKVIGQYRDGRLSGVKYYKLLKKYAEKLNGETEPGHEAEKIDLGRYENLMAYLDLVEKGKSLNYRRIARQLQSFMQVLKQKLPYRAYNTLLEKTDNFSRLDELYLHLGAIVKTYSLDLRASYPDLQVFFDYNEYGSRINPVEMVREERQLVREIRAGLSADVNEREISFLADFLGYYADFLHNKLAAADYEYFKNHFDEFKLLWGKYGDNGYFAGREADIELLTAFYETNVERNESFIKHLVGEYACSNPARDGVSPVDADRTLQNAKEIIVAVTGGFHTEGVQKLLSRRGVSYVAITPNVTQDTALSSLVYTELAKQQALVLSQTFASEPFTSFVKYIREHPGQYRPGDMVALALVFGPVIKAAEDKGFESQLDGLTNDILSDLQGTIRKQKDGSWTITVQEKKAGAWKVELEYRNGKMSLKGQEKLAENEEAVTRDNVALSRLSNYAKGERFFRETGTGRTVFRGLTWINRRLTGNTELSYDRATELFYVTYIKLSDMPLHVVDIIAGIVAHRSITRNDVFRLTGAAGITAMTGAAFLLALHMPFLMLVGSTYLAYGTTHMLYNLAIPWAPLSNSPRREFKEREMVYHKELWHREVTSLTYLGPAKIGGEKDKHFFVDEDNQLWIFKVNSYERTQPYRPLGTVLYYELYRELIGDTPVEVIEITLNGEHGTLEKVLLKGGSAVTWDALPPEKVNEEFKNYALLNAEKLKISDLSEKAIGQLLQEMVLTWLVSEHDGHGGNFLRTEQGDIFRIDMEQVFKYFGSDRLDPRYFPNGEAFAPLSYSLIAKLADEDKLSIELIDAILTRIEEFPEDKFQEMLQPFAEQYSKYSSHPGNQTPLVRKFLRKQYKTYVRGRYRNADDFIRSVLERKRNIRKDFEEYFALVKTLSSENRMQVTEGYDIGSGIINEIGQTKSAETLAEKGNNYNENDYYRRLLQSYYNYLSEKLTAINGSLDEVLSLKYQYEILLEEIEYPDLRLKVLFNLLPAWIDKKILSKYVDHHRIYFARDAGYLYSMDKALSSMKYRGKENGGASVFYLSRDTMGIDNYDLMKAPISAMYRHARDTGESGKEIYAILLKEFKAIYDQNEGFRKFVDAQVIELNNSGYIEMLERGQKLVLLDTGYFGTIPLTFWAIAAKALEDKGKSWYDGKNDTLKMRIALLQPDNIPSVLADDFQGFKLTEVFNTHEMDILSQTYSRSTIDRYSEKIGKSLEAIIKIHPIRYDHVGKRIKHTGMNTYLEMFYLKMFLVKSVIEYLDMERKGRILSDKKAEVDTQVQTWKISVEEMLGVTALRNKYKVIEQINKFLWQNIPEDLRASDKNIDNYELVSYEWLGGQYEIRVVPVTNLLQEKKMLAQIRISEMYEHNKPVIFIDANLNKEERRVVLAREINEIRKWEFFRRTAADYDYDVMKRIVARQSDNGLNELVNQTIRKMRDTDEYKKVAEEYNGIVERYHVVEIPNSFRAIFYDDGFGDEVSDKEPARMTLVGTVQKYIDNHSVARYLYDNDFFGVTKTLVVAWISVAPGPLGAPQAELGRISAALASKLTGDATLYDAFIDEHRPAGMSVVKWQKSAARRNLSAGMASIEALVKTMLPDTGWTNLSDEDIARISAAIVRAHRNYNVATLVRKAFARLDPFSGAEKAASYTTMTLPLHGSVFLFRNVHRYLKFLGSAPELKKKAVYWMEAAPAARWTERSAALTYDGLNSTVIAKLQGDTAGLTPFRNGILVNGQKVTVYSGFLKGQNGARTKVLYLDMPDGLPFTDGAMELVKELSSSRYNQNALYRSQQRRGLFRWLRSSQLGYEPAVILAAPGTAVEISRSRYLQEAPEIFGQTALVTVGRGAETLAFNPDAVLPETAMENDALIKTIAAAARKKKAEQLARSKYLIMSLDILNRPLMDEEWDSLRDIMKTIEGENIRLRGWAKQLAGDAQFKAAQKRIADLRKAGVQVHSDYKVSADGDAVKQKEEIVRLLKDAGFAGVEIDLSAVTWEAGALDAWLADIRRNAPDATITVVLPQNLNREETVKTLAGRSIIVVEDRRINSSAGSSEIRSPGKGVRLIFTGEQTGKPLQSFIRLVDAPLIELSLVDAARIGNEWFNGKNDERRVVLLQKLGRMMPQMIKKNVAALKSLIDETPDMVYESVLKYPAKDVPDMSVWQGQLAKLYDDPLFAAIRKATATGAALPAVDTAFVDAAAGLKIEGAGELKIDQLVRQYRNAAKAQDGPAQQRTAAMLALLLQGLSERVLTRAVLEAGKDPGFTDPMQEKLFGRLLLQEALAGRMPAGPVAYMNALEKEAASTGKPAEIGANLARIMETENADKSLAVNAAVRQLEAVRASSAKPKEKEEAISELLRILYAYGDRKYVPVIEQQKQMQQQSIRAMLGAA